MRSTVVETLPQAIMAEELLRQLIEEWCSRCERTRLLEWKRLCESSRAQVVYATIDDHLRTALDEAPDEAGRAAIASVLCLDESFRRAIVRDTVIRIACAA